MREKLYDGTGREMRFVGGDVTPCLIANGVTLAKQLASTSKQLASNMWIPVTERLPEAGGVVLGYMRSGDYRTLKYKNNTQRWEGLLLDYEKECVTHWMPLPEPPKGEMKNENND